MRTLIVGGTGMLAAATIELARKSKAVVLVARTQSSLEHISEQLPSPVKVTTVQSDWSNQPKFLDDVRLAIEVNGYPDLVLAWLHSNEIGPLLASVVATQNKQTTFVQVCGSMTPHRDVIIDGSLAQLPSSLNFRQVILGHIVDAGGRRWLTHAEICSGVLGAVSSDKPVSIVGCLDE